MINECVSALTPPHGGVLKPLLLKGEECKEEKIRAEELVKVTLNSKELSDLIMLSMGAFSPLNGFLCREDYLRVVNDLSLADGTLWSVPVTLSVSGDKADRIKNSQEVALTDETTGEIMGTMKVDDIFAYDREEEAKNVFSTTDVSHPGVERLYSQGEYYIGGTVKAFSEGDYPSRFAEYARPEETRKIFEEKGWKSVTAFQTRNPLHRSHEYLIKIAMEVSDGVFIHPIVGALKSDDIPADVRMACYKTVISNYLPSERVVLKVYPMEMRYGGPREALLHAIIRQNFGCSSIIIGRDHAGVKDYYGPFDAQKIFDEIPSGSLEIKPLKLDWTFWCYKCEGMASLKTCPHGKEDRLLISGTELRDKLSRGEKPPGEFSRPEVLDILSKYYTRIKG